MTTIPPSSGEGRLAVLQEVALALSGDLDRRRLYDGLVHGARQLLGVPLAIALSFDTGRGELAIEAVASEDPAAPLVPAGDLAVLAGPAFAARTTIAIEDLDSHPRAAALAHALKLGAAAATPLQGNGVALGVLVVARFKSDEDAGAGFGPNELRLLELLAGHVGLALANADTIATAVRRLALAEELAAAVHGILETRDRDGILVRGLDCATSILGADRAAVYLVNSREEISFVASRRLSRAYVEEVTRRYRRSVGGMIPMTRSPIYVADVASDPRTRVLHEPAAMEGLHSLLLLPMLHRGQLFGAVALYHDLVWRYDTQDIARVRGLADQMALALANASLHQQTQRQLAQLRVVAEVARAAAEAGSPAERAQRVASLLVERGAAARAWVLGEHGGLLAAAGADAVTTDVVAAEQAALIAGRAIARAGAEAQLVAAPIRNGEAFGALVLALPPLPPIEPRPPTIFQSVSYEPDLGPELELVGSTAGHLAAGLAQVRQQASGGLAAVLAGLPGGVLVFDDKGRVVFHNQEALAVHGLEGRDVTGWSTIDFVRETGGAVPARVLAEDSGPRQVVVEIERGRVVEHLQGPLRTPDGATLGQLVLYRAQRKS